MPTIVILGAGQFGQTAATLLNTNELQLLAYADNNPRLQNTFYGKVPILSVEQAIVLQPDLALVGVTDPDRTIQLRNQALACGFQGRFLLLSELYNQFDIRSATLIRLAARIEEASVPGAIAELGVYQGDLARKLNALFPQRSLYLFDTFTGFDHRDIIIESGHGYSQAQENEFSNTTMEKVLSRLPYPAQAIYRKGYFPDTITGLDTIRYALVSLDADLYMPIFSGLEYFYPRLNSGGIILLHDFNNSRFQGSHQAVRDYEKKQGTLPLIPLCDLHGSAVIIHP